MTSELKIDKDVLNSLTSKIEGMMEFISDNLSELNGDDMYTAIRAYGRLDTLLEVFHCIIKQDMDTMKTALLLASPLIPKSIVNSREQETLQNYISEHHNFMQHDEKSCAVCNKNSNNTKVIKVDGKDSKAVLKAILNAIKD